MALNLWHPDLLTTLHEIENIYDLGTEPRDRTIDHIFWVALYFLSNTSQILEP